MEKGQNYTESEWAALSPEQRVEALRIEKAVDPNGKSAKDRLTKQMSESWRAIYKDAKGGRYSAPIEKQSDGAWAMLSSDGPIPITHQFQDDAAGTLTFVEYKEVPDSRLHVERLPGESSLGALQRAYAEKVVAQERRDRQQARKEIQNANMPDPRRVQAARNANNYAASQMRPHRGPAVITYIKGD